MGRGSLTQTSSVVNSRVGILVILLHLGLRVAHWVRSTLCFPSKISFLGVRYRAFQVAITLRNKTQRTSTLACVWGYAFWFYMSYSLHAEAVGLNVHFSPQVILWVTYYGTVNNHIKLLKVKRRTLRQPDLFPATFSGTYPVTFP